MLIGVAAPLVLLSIAGDAPAPDPAVPWWVLAIAFVVGDLAAFNIEFKREAHAFTFSEVPLVLGLFFTAPLGILAARLLGSVAAGLRERQSPVKLLFNASLALAGCSLAVALFRILPGGASVDDPQAWLVVFGAVLAVDLLDAVCVARVIRWHGGEPNRAQLVLAGATTAIANTSLGLASAILLWTNVFAGVLIVVVAAVLLLAYRAYALMAQRYVSLRVFYEFTNAVGGATRAEPVLESILSKSRELLRADVAVISIAADDGTGQVLRLSARRDARPEPAIATSLVEPDWLRAHVVDAQQMVVIHRDSPHVADRAVLADLGARDALIAPLVGKAAVIGVITVADRLGELNTFDHDSERMLATLANHAAVAIENGKLVERLNREVREREHDAHHDALTGLPNRIRFFDLLQHRMQGGADSFAVLLMDLDGFRELNDTLGHSCGDLLLSEVARRLPSSLPTDAAVARLGGDEFAILLPNASSVAGARQAAQSIRAVLTEPFQVEGVDLDTSASIGIAFWPHDAEDVADLLKCAEVAMYGAKTLPAGIDVYEPERDEHSLDRLTIAARLRRAIDNLELDVHYQPILRVADGTPVGVEALVRWHDREHGPVRPDDFIGVAERTGLIRPLTSFVLRRALEDCAAWRRAGTTLGVSVNLSPRSLIDPELPTEVERVISQCRAEPGWLTLEVTESTVMDPRSGVSVLERLAALGVRLAIDDFGTGYSALAYLRLLPIQELKVDQSFVMAMDSDPSNAKIVRTIVDLAHTLGLDVVAEGVETRSAWESLQAMGCDAAQGYFLCRPAPATEVAAWFEDRPARLRVVS